jgi:hypothetical protein
MQNLPLNQKTVTVGASDLTDQDTLSNYEIKIKGLIISYFGFNPANDVLSEFAADTFRLGVDAGQP